MVQEPHHPRRKDSCWPSKTNMTNHLTHNKWWLSTISRWCMRKLSNLRSKWWTSRGCTMSRWWWCRGRWPCRTNRCKSWPLNNSSSKCWCHRSLWWCSNNSLWWCNSNSLWWCNSSNQSWCSPNRFKWRTSQWCNPRCNHKWRLPPWWCNNSNQWLRPLTLARCHVVRLMLLAVFLSQHLPTRQSLCLIQTNLLLWVQ